MKRISIRLMTMLRLLSNQCEPGEQRGIEAELQSDPIAFAHLQKLRDVVNHGTIHLYDGSVDSPNGRNMDDSYSQRIAAFLDQTLNAKETVSFENDCWNSPDLLRDVFVLYQSGLQAQASDLAIMDRLNSSTPEQLLRQRLVDLFPAAPSNSPKQHSRVAVPLPLAILQQSPSTDREVKSDAEIPIVVTPRSTLQNHRTQISRATVVLISVAAMVAIVTISIGVINWRSNRSIPTVDLQPPVKSGIPNTPNQPPIKTPAASGLADDSRELLPDKRIVAIENPEILGPEKNPSRDVIGPALPRDDKRSGLVDSVNPTTMQTHETVEKTPDDLVGSPNTPTPLPPSLPWSWGRVEGLVAVRASGSDRWSGALAENVLGAAPNHVAQTETIGATGWDCKVLPFSWAQANLNGMGVWTIAENTDFSIASTSVGGSENYGPESNSSNVDSLRVEINLQRGRIAISDAKIDSVVSIKTVTGTWAIRITSDSSVVIVEQDVNSQVWVQAGSARINGMELKSRQQLTRKRDGRLEEQTVNRQSVKWLRKPENKFPDKGFSNQWLVSRDLFADLSQAEVVSVENQSLLRAAFATIDPPGQAVKYLANVMPEVRAEGIQWLVAYGQDERQMRHLCGEMAKELGAPGLRATLPRLVIAINRKRLPPKADVESLIAGLQHQNPSVRRLSNGFLVHLFGSIVAYDPESNAAARNVEARQWLAAINRLYRRVDNARQR